MPTLIEHLHERQLHFDQFDLEVILNTDVVFFDIQASNLEGFVNAFIYESLVSSKNQVLCRGYRLHNGQLHNYAKSSVVQYLLANFGHLFHILKCQGMAELLQHQLFVKLNNGCLLQLSGPPANSINVLWRMQQKYLQSQKSNLQDDFDMKDAVSEASTRSDQNIDCLQVEGDDVSVDLRELEEVATEVTKKDIRVTLRQALMFKRSSGCHFNNTLPLVQDFLSRIDVVTQNQKSIKPYVVANIDRLVGNAHKRLNKNPRLINQLLDHYCPNKGKVLEMQQVVRFVKVVLVKVLSLEFFGSELNHIVNNVERYILKLRKFESFPQSYKFTEKVKLLPWMFPSQSKGKVNNAEHHRMLQGVQQRAIRCLIFQFVIPMLWKAFYITDSGVHKNKVFYYRHDTWNDIVTVKKDKLNYMPLTTQQIDVLPKSSAVSKLRLLPKTTGFRPVVNLTRQISIKGNPVRCAKNLLVNSYNVLLHEKDQNGNMNGSMIGMQDIYKNLKDYKIKYKQNLDQGLYMVKVDVVAAFDTIKQDKLIEVLQEIIESEYYVIHSYQIKHVTHGLRYKSFDKYAQPANQELNFVDLCYKLSELVTHKIFIDSVSNVTYTKAQVLKSVQEHIQNNLVLIDGALYKQVEGIPQGSMISSILCSLFYGHLQRKHLSEFDTEGSLHMRFIDDFIYITQNKSMAQKFVEVMHRGFPSYGAFCSPSKTVTNFDERYMLDTNWMPWCGHAINFQSLDVRIDMSRLYGSFLSDSLTVSYVKNPCLDLNLKLKLLQNPKCQPWYLDTSMNSVDTSLWNIYANFITVAMKFALYLKHLPFVNEMMVSRTLDAYLQDGVTMILAVAFQPISKQVGFKLFVTKDELVWLAAKAFVFVLRHKRQLPVVVDRLQVAILNIEERMSGKLGRLKGVIAQFNNEAVFDRIIFL